MEYRTKRRIHDQGGSFLITLPKLWADAVGIKTGSEVDVSFNGVVKVMPPKCEGDPNNDGEHSED